MSHPVTWAKRKQDPLGGTYVSPRDVGKKKTRPMWDRRDSVSPLLRDKQYPVPSHWVREELINAPPPIKGDTGAYPVPPIVAPPSNLPQLREDIGAHPMGVHPLLLPIISEES